jgi:flagellar protein FlaJ
MKNYLKKFKEKFKASNKVLSIPDPIVYPYRILGEKIVRIAPFFQDLKPKLLKANLRIDFQAYIAFILFFSSIASFGVFITTILIGLGLGLPLILLILTGIALSILSGTITFMFLYAYPSLIVDSRKRILENELPYIASYMAILSKTGITPERIFRSLGTISTKGFKSISVEEAKNIIRSIDFFGYDIISALKLESELSPSLSFSGFIDGLISVSRSGGDITSYLITSSKAFMNSARIATRKLVDTLALIAEVYVSLIVVFPLVAVVMLAVMGLIGGTLAGFNIIFLMQLITYILLPFLAIIMLMLLEGIMPSR